jgi:regulatory factor X 1/2/3
MAALNNGSLEQEVPLGTNQSVVAETILGIPYHITTTVTSSYEVGSGGLDPTFEGLADHATNEQVSFPLYTGDGTESVYTTACDQLYSGNTTKVTYSYETMNSTRGSNSGQFLAEEKFAYLTEQECDPEATDISIIEQTVGPQAVTAERLSVECMNPGTTTTMLDACRSFSHTTRISPESYKWLTQNFELATDESLPRSTVYNYYLRHCEITKKYPINAATFGKKFRAVFPELKLRRLGMRGKSKCHYYGIRVIPGSELNELLGDGQSGVRQQPSSSKLCKLLSDSGGNVKQEIENQHEQPQHLHQHQCLGYLSNFPDIQFPSGLSLPEDCTKEDVYIFVSIYRKHSELLMKAVVNLEFQSFQSLWTDLWRSQDNDNDDECEEEMYLSKRRLYLLCKFGPVQEFVRDVDYMLYQKTVETLFPNILNPIQISSTHAICDFAKDVESWLKGAMADCPEEMVCIKLLAVNALTQMLRRYISLSHVAQAANAVLQDSSQIDKMLVDLNRVDFRNVREQASWVCHCDESMVQQLEADFKKMLCEQNSLEQWAAWIKGVVVQVLEPYEGKPNFAKAASYFLLKWSFYTSAVIRNLTFPCAETFGSFHLLRLLHDEYISFLILHQVALHTGQIPIIVFGNKYSQSPTNASDFIQSVPVGMTVDLTTSDDEINAVNHHLLTTKRLKIG